MRGAGTNMARTDRNQNRNGKRDRRGALLVWKSVSIRAPKPMLVMQNIKNESDRQPKTKEQTTHKRKLLNPPP
eukprot:6490018-Amphidinium_carterae.1